MTSLAPSQSDPEIRSSFRKRENKKQTQKQQNKTICISQYCQPGELVKKLSLCRCRKTHPPYSFSTNEEDWRLVLPSLIHRAKSILARWWCSVWWSHSAKGFRHEDGPRESPGPPTRWGHNHTHACEPASTTSVDTGCQTLTGKMVWTKFSLVVWPTSWYFVIAATVGLMQIIILDLQEFCIWETRKSQVSHNSSAIPTCVVNLCGQVRVL